MTLCHPKMQPHTKLGITSSNNRWNAQDTIILKTRSEIKITVTEKMVHGTMPSQDASTHLIWNSYLKEYRSFAPDLMQILETRSEVKVTVTGNLNGNLNGTIRISKMHSYAELPSKIHLHTKFGIPTSKNIRDVLNNSIILKTSAEVKVKVTVTRIWYVTLCHPKVHLHTKFGIPNSYRRYAPDSKQFLETRS